MPAESFTGEFEVRPVPERPVRRSGLRGYAMLSMTLLAVAALLVFYGSKESGYRDCVASTTNLKGIGHWTVPASSNAATRRCAKGWPDWMLF